MQIPEELLNLIRDGNAVLLLGSGASTSASDASGNRPPMSKALAALIADRFLTADYRNSPLAEVGEYAIGRHGFVAIQSFIRDVFLPFTPSESHLKIPTFRWRAIATTNYDLIVENAYDRVSSRTQTLAPILRNEDKLDNALRDESIVPYLKLHGCINRIRDEGCQFVLSTEQYLAATNGRDKLFRTLMNIAGERSIVFAGYGLQDSDLLAILKRIEREQTSRPTHYLVLPGFDQIRIEHYAKRKIVAISGTFEEFIKKINSAIPATFRGLRKTAPVGIHAITARFAVHDVKMSEATEKALTLDYDFVNGARAEHAPDALRFYSGVLQGWGPIERGFDVKRRLGDSIIQDYLLDEAATTFEFILIKAYAGAGKSVFLRRIAWDTAKIFNRLCLFLRPDGRLPSAPLAELIRNCNERIYLFIDDVLAHRTEIESLVSNLGKYQDRLTIVGSARTNEWNMAPTSLQSLVSHERILSYLSQLDIDCLVDLLEKHEALNKLALLPHDERGARLKEHAGRVLLVALHEATSGLPFEELLHNEFTNLQPAKARKIYLAVCMLNQFGVPVRAGIVSRRFGINFEQFKQQFFAPLEDVVITVDRRGLDDYCYTARHPHIAAIVVSTELKNQEDYYEEFIGVLTELDIQCNGDQKAYQKMTQARLLQEKFSNPDLVYSVFERAAELSEAPKASAHK